MPSLRRRRRHEQNLPWHGEDLMPRLLDQAAPQEGGRGAAQEAAATEEGGGQVREVRDALVLGRDASQLSTPNITGTITPRLLLLARLREHESMSRLLR